MNASDEQAPNPLEDLARAAYETAIDDEAPPRDSVVEAVRAAARNRSPIRLPDLPGAEPTPSGGTDSVVEAEIEDPFTRYEIQGRIARGGMGIVLKGRDRQLGREVAIKVLDRRHAANPAMIERFIEEAQIGGQLQHPGIVPVQEVGYRSDRRPYFVMKLVKGQTLGRLLAERADPGQDRRRYLDVFERLCQTMAYAHARSVVHRDLKPANVMVGAFGEVQIMDWGLAKVLGDDREKQQPSEEAAGKGRTIVETVRTAGSDTRSHAGSVMGTPAYMPPEQARGEVDRIDARSDVFALGAILCEILTGEPPYVAETFSKVRQKAQAGDLTEALARLDSRRLDEDLDRLTRDCLAQESQDRPANAGVVAESISAYLASLEERVRAAEVGAARAEARAVAERRVRKRTVLAAVSLFAAIVVISGGYLWMDHGRRQRQRRANDKVVSALQAAIAAHEQALVSATADPAKWAEVKVLISRAKGLAEDTDVDVALRKRAEALHSRLERDAAAAREAAARAEKDRRMAARLDEIRIRSGDQDQLDHRQRDLDYANAFREYGIDVETLDPGQAAERIRASRMTAALVNALDLWTSTRRRYLGRENPGWRRLYQMAEAVDTDPVRRKIRRATHDRDVQALQAIAHSKRMEERPVDEILRVAMALRAVDDLEGAVKLLQAAVRKHAGGDFWVHYMLSICLYDLKPPRLDAAVQHGWAAVAIRPESANAWNTLGVAQKASGRTDRAIESFERALEINGRCVPAVCSLAQTYIEKGESDRAIEIHRQMPRGGPGEEDARIYLSLGLAHRVNGDLEAARDAYRTAIRLRPDYSEAWNNLGHVLVLERKIEEARAAFAKAIEADPAHVNPYLGLTDLLMKTRKLEEAREWMEKVLSISEDDAAVQNVYGHFLERTGRIDQAIVAYRKAATRRATKANYWNDLGIALGRHGRLEEALLAFDRTIRLQPDHVKAHQNRGSILARMKRWNEALSSFEEALRHGPDDPRTLYKLGGALLNLNRLEEALSAFKKAHAIGARRPGWRYQSARQITLCERFLALAKRVNAIQAGEPEPDEVGERIALARCARRIDMHATAARLWRSAFRDDPGLERGRSLVEAASSAALAGTGAGKDAESLDEPARSNWFVQAVTWLQAYVDAVAEVLERRGESTCSRAREALLEVRRSADLAGLRDLTHLARLSKEDRYACIMLWAKIGKLLVECGE